MKRISAILVMALVVAMTVVPVCAIDVTVAMSTPSTTIDAGTDFSVAIDYTPASEPLASFEAAIYYDAEKIDYKGTYTLAAGATGTVNKTTDGRIKIAIASADAWTGNFLTLDFASKAEVSGTAEFTLEVDLIDDVDMNGEHEALDVTPLVMTIGGSEPDPEPEVFAISATESGNDVVVTVDNADLAVGEEIKVYVATYTDGDVLVTCQEQALVDGTMTFTGLANANAKVFVWDNQNVPVADVTIQ